MTRGTKIELPNDGLAPDATQTQGINEGLPGSAPTCHGILPNSTLGSHQEPVYATCSFLNERNLQALEDLTFLSIAAPFASM